MLRCAQSARYNVPAKYASARRFFARLASEILLSSLQPEFFSQTARENPMRYFVLLVALALASPAAAASDNQPKRKSGLWEIKMSGEQTPGMPAIQQCVDEKTDDLMTKDMGENQKTQCSKNETRKEGDKLVAESVCKIENSTVKTRAVFTGRFDSAYKADIKSSYDPPLRGMKEASSVIEAKWLGPCKAGQRPGDVSIPGMPNINMDAIRKGATKRP
jgi:hypothetical protein